MRPRPSSNPDAAEIWRDRYDLAVIRFKSRLIGEITFRCDLWLLGFTDEEINREVMEHRR